jgi:hypothetical protein
MTAHARDNRTKNRGHPKGMRSGMGLAANHISAALQFSDNLIPEITVRLHQTSSGVKRQGHVQVSVGCDVVLRPVQRNRGVIGTAHNAQANKTHRHVTYSATPVN